MPCPLHHSSPLIGPAVGCSMAQTAHSAGACCPTTRPTTRPRSAAASSRTTWRWRRRSSWRGTWTRQVWTGFAPGLTKLGQVWSVRITQTGQFKFAPSLYLVSAKFVWFVLSSVINYGVSWENTVVDK